MTTPSYLSFRLSDTFLTPFKEMTPDWGFQDPAGNSLGEGVFLRSYSRRKDDGSKERWWEVCRRVIEGMYSIQKDHCKTNHLPWQDKKAQRSAQEAYGLLFDLKWSPPGRGLQMMGTPIVNELRDSTPLQNCSFRSTKDIDKNFSKAFRFLQEASMLGVGVGVDTRGSEHHMPVLAAVETDEVHVIPDTREGWVEATGIIIDAFMHGTSYPIFDYCQIRPEGAPIKTFGGIAGGPQPLIDLHTMLTKLLIENIGGEFDSRLITDIANMIGVCTASGNTRRSAIIVIGDKDDDVFLNLKNYDENPYRKQWGWMSNNSLSVKPGDNYSKYTERIIANGEPGFVWMDNVRSFARMNGEIDTSDHRAEGFNPCVSGDTEILTENGYVPIVDLIGKDVNVWNGREWSQVTPFSTGVNPLLMVSLSDGTSLKTTPYHEWLIVRDGKEVRIKAVDLIDGDKLAKYEMPIVNGTEPLLVDAYSQGFYSGDGSTDLVKSSLYEPKYCCAQRLVGTVGKEVHNKKWKTWYHGQMLDKTFVPMNQSVTDKLNWLAGVMDADGTVLFNPNSTSLQLSSSDERFLLTARKMLTTLGVQSKVTKARDAAVRSMPNGKGGSADYNCKNQYRLIITASDTLKLVELGMKCERLKLEAGTPNRDARRFVTVTDVVPFSDGEETFCLTEPLNHSMTAEGIVTGQCGEQPLESSEFCTLSNLYASRCTDWNEFRKAVKYSFLYAKTVTLVPTRWEESNAIMQRNRRVGVSLGGQAEIVDRDGYAKLRDWMQRGHDEIERLDGVYSEWLTVRKSLRTTTVKPDGSTGLLAGVSPGVHWPVATTYIRRMRLGNNDPLLAQYKECGYRTEPTIGSESTTTCVEVPIRSSVKGFRNERQVSIHEKMFLGVLAQKNWSNNGVSITVTFDREKEGKDIERLLSMYDDSLKAVSFLPFDDHYEQMPYESLTEEEMDAYMEGLDLKPLNLDWLYGNGIDIEPDQGCSTDMCEIKAAKL